MIWLLLAVVQSIVFSLWSFQRIEILDTPLVCVLAVCVLLGVLNAMVNALSHIQLFPAILFVSLTAERVMSWIYIDKLHILHQRMILLFAGLTTCISQLGAGMLSAIMNSAS